MSVSRKFHVIFESIILKIITAIYKRHLRAVVFTSPLFLPRRCFYLAVVFTSPLFLPRRCFYLAVVFTSPLFLPRRCFYRAVVFTAPLFLPRRCFYRAVVFTEFKIFFMTLKFLFKWIINRSMVMEGQLKIKDDFPFLQVFKIRKYILIKPKSKATI
jgi:hypothetical protein